MSYILNELEILFVVENDLSISLMIKSPSDSVIYEVNDDIEYCSAFVKEKKRKDESYLHGFDHLNKLHDKDYYKKRQWKKHSNMFEFLLNLDTQCVDEIGEFIDTVKVIKEKKITDLQTDIQKLKNEQDLLSNAIFKSKLELVQGINKNMSINNEPLFTGDTISELVNKDWFRIRLRPDVLMHCANSGVDFNIFNTEQRLLPSYTIAQRIEIAQTVSKISSYLGKNMIYPIINEIAGLQPDNDKYNRTSSNKFLTKFNKTFARAFHIYDDNGLNMLNANRAAICLQNAIKPNSAKCYTALNIMRYLKNNDETLIGLKKKKIGSIYLNDELYEQMTINNIDIE